MPEPLISAEKLGKQYKLSHQSAPRYTTLRESITSFLAGRRSSAASIENFWALRDVSFEVQRGDVLGIIGRNGAGKSTLLKILSRITEPTEGRLALRGRVASLLEVGTGFHPELTGRENIRLNGAILGMTRAEIDAKFDEIVAFAEVERFLDTPVKRYSSGMYVRLAFAVAAHLEPEILVIDEVLAVGDASFQDKCLGKMEDVSRKEGRTVLFVSHNMEAIDRLTKRSILLHEGRIAADGPTSEVVGKYLSSPADAADLARFRAKHLPQTVALTRIWTESLEGRPAHTFRQGEGLRIHVEIDASITSPVDVAVVIETGGQHALFTTHLSDLGNPLSGVTKHCCSFDLRQPHFRRGRYLVSCAVFSPDQTSFYDVVHHYPLFEIAGTADTSIPDDIRWGDLYYPIAWDVHTA